MNPPPPPKKDAAKAEGSSPSSSNLDAASPSSTYCHDWKNRQERAQSLANDTILKPIRQAQSRQQQLDQLKSLDLAPFLENDDVNNDKKSFNQELVFQVALSLIQTIPVFVGSDVEQALLDALERITTARGGGGGGAFLILSVVLQTLKELSSTTSSASNNNNNANEQNTATRTIASSSTALSTALAALYRIVCAFPKNRSNSHHHHHDDNVVDDDKKNSDPQSSESSSSSNNHHYLQTMSLWNNMVMMVDEKNNNNEDYTAAWIGQVLLVPQLAANAAALVGNSILPRWLTPPSRYLVRLVESACCHHYYYYYEQQQQQYRRRRSLLSVLVQHMMRRGHAHHVARGLYQFLLGTQHSDKKSKLKEASVVAKKADMIGALLVGDKDDTGNHLLLSPRETGLLYHALLKLVLSRREEKDGHDDKDETCLLEEEAIQTIFRPVLERGGLAVQEALVRQVVLSSSYGDARGYEKMDYPKRVCNEVVRLLLSVPNSSSNDDDDDDDSDDDEEEDTRRSAMANATPHRALVRQLNDVSLVWSQPIAFVQKTNPARQHFVSCFLCSALDLLHESQAEHQREKTGMNNNTDESTMMAADWELQDLLSAILQGVTIRLESTHHDSIRRDGMRVGEALARLLGQELKFDELNEERADAAKEQRQLQQLENGKDKDHNDESRQQKKDRPEKTSTRTRKSMKRRQRARQARLMDPDAAYVSSEDEDEQEDVGSDEESSTSESSLEDSVWDDDDEDLLPYDLQDDQEDLRETPKPLYLKDCLDMLRTPETNEHAVSRHETALESLAPLVRSSPMDAVDIAPHLALQLLHMENKFEIECFEETVASSLTALLVQQPQSVAEAIISDFYKGDLCLTDRLKVLTALNHAAYELSGVKELEDRNRQQQQQQQQQIQPNRNMRQPRVSGKRSLVGSAMDDAALSAAVEKALSKTDEPVTRQWGKPKQQRFLANRCNRIGPTWFLALIQGFLESKEDAKLWGGANGATMLARLFLTLATLTEFSGLGTEFHSPGNTSLACHLLDLVCGFMMADVAHVRLAALCSAATCLALLRSDQLLRILYNAQNEDSNNNLPMLLQRIAREDPDDLCQRLAQTISGQMVRALQDSSLSSLSYY